MRDKLIQNLNELSDEINNLYGYVKVEGENIEEPAINVGPCGPFANAFYNCWNKSFDQKVSIAFIMVKNSDECWHVLIRLPNGMLFDGGLGVHDEQKYKDKFIIEDMKDYDLKLLEQRSHGLEREYPRYCPNFSLTAVTSLIEKHLDKIKISIDENEIPLNGGRVTQGVVLIGNNVHRPKGQHSDFVHQLLDHLESVNFQGAPRFLGIDELGREILSYIEGDVPTDLGMWADSQLIAAAQLIRQYHDATAGSVVAGKEEVVCHNDLSPCNTVMKDGLPIALIDFDAASPGKRIHDLAYAIWLWCDLGNEEIKPIEQLRRIKLFCDAYGFSENKEILASIVDVQKEYAKKFQDEVEKGLPEWNNAVTWAQNSLQWVIKNISAEQSHDEIINTIILSCFGQVPKFIRRMTIGISNEVYNVGLNDNEVIVRMSPQLKYLMGSHDHIPKFKELGIAVPNILAEDYSKTQVPFAWQVQSKIEGMDLGEVIESLTGEQLVALAQEIASIFNKVKTLPVSNQFGVIWGGGDNELDETWTHRMKIWIDESKERGNQTGVMDSELSSLADSLYVQYKSYFDSVTPIMYYGDICSKNVMIKNGKFNGLVDLDGLTQGDPLEAIGRIKLSWYGTHHGTQYSNAVMEALGLNSDQRKLVIVYALLNMISWTCENGIQFNLNTQAVVDKDKERRDKEKIKTIVAELRQ